MRLREVYDILKNTELKQIIIGENEDQIISLMNLGLIEVYGKFSILQEELIINIVPGQTRYRLPDNAQKVLQVYYRDTNKRPLLGDDQFTEVPVNDINCDESVFTPQPYVLHIPNPEVGRIYSVIYIATPPYINKGNIDTVDLIFPPQFLAPFTNYVAYRAYKSMNGSEQSEISTHWKAYIASCNDVYKNGLVQNTLTTNMKAFERGFPTNNTSMHER
jgi:hypothetical protein